MTHCVTTQKSADLIPVLNFKQDRQCKYNEAMRRFRVTTAAIQTQKFCMSLWTIQKYWNYCHQSETTRSLRTVEPYVAVKNIKMLCCYGNVKFYCCRATKNVVLLSTMQTYLGIHVNRLRFLSDFNQIWFFSTALHIRLQRWLQISFQLEASCYMRASGRHAEGNTVKPA